MSKPDDIPDDVIDAAATAYIAYVDSQAKITASPTEDEVMAVAARAILAERERWAPAVTYFDRYCRDEAEDIEYCVCGEQQHIDAKNFREAIRKGSA